jgi:hypothetical protein
MHGHIVFLIDGVRNIFEMEISYCLFGKAIELEGPKEKKIMEQYKVVTRVS